MPIFNFHIPNNILKALRLPQNNHRRQQLRVLRKLLRKARFTEFGQQYRFDEILLSKHPGKKFQEQVPVANYSSMYKNWWHKTMSGAANVTWPGKIRYYA
ncbi:MAG: GH3 auxin-responsive promoter family protein, partial [Sediminibacterium sp.]|nr:GH3 auxin-responsive promoter family protein [Sediminibacterium sp.]